ncbi:MAG: hypothetical protein HGA85_07095 [Nanoarchaeota archaeon]|nr:hypothetical protein [Nanoarchaeota archaeon]
MRIWCAASTRRCGHASGSRSATRSSCCATPTPGGLSSTKVFEEELVLVLDSVLGEDYSNGTLQEVPNESVSESPGEEVPLEQEPEIILPEEPAYEEPAAEEPVQEEPINEETPPPLEEEPQNEVPQPEEEIPAPANVTAPAANIIVLPDDLILYDEDEPVDVVDDESIEDEGQVIGD